MEMGGVNLLNPQGCFTVKVSFRSTGPCAFVVFSSVRVFPSLSSKSSPFYILKALKVEHTSLAHNLTLCHSEFLEEQVGSPSAPRGKEGGTQLARRPCL